MQEPLFVDVWDTAARLKPDAAAVVQGERTVTWHDVARRAESVAAALVAAGLGRQAKVAQYLFNAPEYVESVYACYKAGLVPVNTNYRYADEELAYLWDNADVEAVVFHSSFADRAERVRRRVPGVRLWLCVDDGHTPCPPWAVPYEKAAAAGEVLSLPWARTPDDLLLIYTGGTTGLPKGVMWRLEDYFAVQQRAMGEPFGTPPTMEAVARVLQGPAPTIVVASPLMHGTGFSGMHSALSAGGTVVLLPSRSFDAVELLDAIATHGAVATTVVGDVFTVPVVEALEREPARWDLSRLRIVSSSGAMWSAAVKERLLAALPPKVKLVDGLASTEGAGMATSVTSASASDGAATAQFTLEPTAVVLGEDGTPVVAGSGVVGRLCSTGALPIGYYKDEARTASTFVTVNGTRYVVSGDYATVEADGTIRLLGRGSICINTGGEKVFPEEVEEVLKELPTVVDAVVVGVPDPRFGEAIAALVVPADRAAPPTAEAVKSHAKHRLAGYKAPRHVLVVDSAERGPNGKADYGRLRQHAMTVLGLDRPSN